VSDPEVPEVRRVDFGYFLRPAAETATGLARVEPCLGYAVRHGGGVLLVDTGMGSEPEVDAHYHPRRVPLDLALRAAGTGTDEVTGVANCHLHFDHCGGNPALAGRPIFTQRAELQCAQTTVDYTLPELVDAPGLRYELLDGEVEIFPGIIVVPTPGHTAGHQSIVVRRGDGTVIVAGQSHDTSSRYAADVLAHRAAVDRSKTGAAAPDGDDGDGAVPPPVPGWVERLQRLDPARVVFAHDHSIWVP
jgi:N-acyl homoserine lactone hydrolase